jgi:hypothetical protein
MKKKLIISVFVLLGICQTIFAQTDGVDYSLDGISRSLRQYQIVSLGTFYNGLARIEIKQNGQNRYGLINKFGKVILPCENSYLDEKIKIGEGLILLYNRDLFAYGYVDINGKSILPFQYEKAKPFSEGLAVVQTIEDKESGKKSLKKLHLWRFIDKQGNTIIPHVKGLDEKRIGEFHDGVAAIGSYDETNENETFYLIDKQGNVIVSEKPYRCIGKAENLFIVRNEKRGTENRMFGLMDKGGKMVIPFAYRGMQYASDGLVCVINTDGKVGYLDLQGNIRIPFQFDKGGVFVNGIALVKKDGITIAINQKGEVLFHCPYQEIYSFHEGLAAIRQNDKWGFINEKGEIEIPCQFDYVGDFSEGLAMIKKEGKQGYMNKQGITILR